MRQSDGVGLDGWMDGWMCCGAVDGAVREGYAAGMMFSGCAAVVVHWRKCRGRFANRLIYEDLPTVDCYGHLRGLHIMLHNFDALRLHATVVQCCNT